MYVVYRFWNIQRDLETGGRGRSRLLKMALFDRSYTTFYWSAIVCKYSCMLYHFQVIWPWIIVTMKRSLKIIQTIRKLWCGFTFHSNYGCIFNRLWDIQRQRTAWPWKLGEGLFKIIDRLHTTFYWFASFWVDVELYRDLEIWARGHSR